MSRAAMQMALEALVTCCAEEWRTLNNFGMKQVYDEKKVNAAIAALHAALAEPECKCTMRQKMVGDGCAVCNPERAKDLAEPQTTHWEGCEAVHPECKEKSNGS